MYPKIIKTNSEYEKMLEEVESLIVLDPDPGTEEAERLDLLSLLIKNYESEKFPIDLPDPIEAIKFRMEEQGLKQKDLIPFIGSKSKVSEVLTGKRSLTVAMIRALNKGLGIPAGVLVQQSQKKDDSGDEIDYTKFPIKEMIKRKWTKTTLKEVKNNENKFLENFFAPLCHQNAISVFCRRTLVERSGKSMDIYTLWAWIAYIQIKAKSMQISQYKSMTVDEAFMKQIAQLSLSENGPIVAQKYLAEHGIALIIEPHLPKTHLDGAAMLSLDGKPIIGLTIRYDRLDNFWFNLLHELAHIYKHLTNQLDETFVDDLDSDPGDDPREREADRLVGEILIPRAIWTRSNAYRKRTPEAIQQLALKLHIHPAIIAGRIRNDTKNYYILSQMVGIGEVRKLFPETIWN